MVVDLARIVMKVGGVDWGLGAFSLGGGERHVSGLKTNIYTFF